MLRVFTAAIIALAIAYIADGRDAVAKNFGNLFRFKVAPTYYAFALLYPAVVGCIALGILWLIGAVDDIHFDFDQAAGWRFLSLTSRVAAVEELAWLGFLLVFLARRYRLFQARLVIGLVWGAWYIPLVVANIQVAPGLPVIPLLLNFMTMAAICGWLYRRTRARSSCSSCSSRPTTPAR